MAFVLPEVMSTVDRLGTLQKGIAQPTTGNILQKLTLELKSLYNYHAPVSSLRNTEDTSNTHIIINQRWKCAPVLLGTGTFSKVHHITDQCIPNKTYALKVYQEEYTTFGLREAIILHSLKSYALSTTSYFIQFHNSFITGQRLCLRLEYMQSNLYTFIQGVDSLNHQQIYKTTPIKVIKPIVIRRDDNMTIFNLKPNVHKIKIDIYKIQHIALSLMNACLILSKEGIIHSDLKPENIFISYKSADENLSFSTLSDLPSEFHIKIGDFSNSFHKSEVHFDSDMDYNLQSLPYRAPEVLFGCPFGCQIDIWSIGIILVELILQKPLFIATSRIELLQKISKFLSPPPLKRFVGGKYYDILSAHYDTTNSAPTLSFNYYQHTNKIHKLLDEFVSNIPHDLVHFLAGLLHPNPDERISPLEALQHKFLLSNINVPLVALTSTIHFAGTSSGSSYSALKSSTAKVNSFRASFESSNIRVKTEKVTQEVVSPTTQEKESTLHSSLKIRAQEEEEVLQYSHSSLLKRTFEKFNNVSNSTSIRNSVLYNRVGVGTDTVMSSPTVVLLTSNSSTGATEGRSDNLSAGEKLFKF